MLCKTETKKQLGISCSREEIAKILAVGHKFDINNGGLYDARIGCVNFWCSPEDKPICWDKEIIQGVLNYPRDYVGRLYWALNEATELFDLYIDVSPYAVLDKRKPTELEWQKIVEWTEQQAKNILRLAEII